MTLFIVFLLRGEGELHEMNLKLKIYIIFYETSWEEKKGYEKEWERDREMGVKWIG